ncbi:MAG: hypothetical protein ACRDPY_31350 [Streptosporangiaceae bacterium]
MRYVELRRHTDNEGDRLTPQGAADAEMIGRDGLHWPSAAFVSTGAARATQMLEILRHAAGQDDTPITAATGLRSSLAPISTQLIRPSRQPGEVVTFGEFAEVSRVGSVRWQPLSLFRSACRPVTGCPVVLISAGKEDARNRS